MPDMLKLNPAQKKAVETIEGPVMVIAGPGTGKTQVLTARIAEIIKQTDTQPQNILALTFTESAAHTMRERLVKMIGTTGMYVHICTFHAFCQGVMNEYPDYFPLHREAKPLTDSERFAIMEKVITELPLEVLKPLNHTFFYLKDILKAISDLKREGVSTERFITLVEQSREETEKNKAKQKELAAVYRAYEKALQYQKRYDFDDMIMMVQAAFELHPDLLSEYQERLQYILVDEYQDTNSAQNTLVFQLASFWGEDANLCVVGDPHQSIYRFQGASTENVRSFAERYSSAAVITLTTGYRCTQQMYDAAHALVTPLAHQEESVSQEKTPALEEVFLSLKHTLTSSNEQQGKTSIHLWSAQSQTTELSLVAEKINALLKNGVAAREIAILYRNNKEAQEVMTILASYAVPFELEGGKDVLTHPVVMQILKMLTAIASLKAGAGEEHLFEVFSLPWLEMDTVTLYTLMRTAALNKISIAVLLQLEEEEIKTQAATQGMILDEMHLGTIRTFYAQLLEWGKRETHEPLPDWFSSVLSESGFLSWLKTGTHDPTVFMVITTLFSYVQRMVHENHTLSLSDLLQIVQTFQAHGLSLPYQDIAVQKDAVTLSTVHKAKGREWEYVFLIHCKDGVWGNGRTRVMLPLPRGVLRHISVEQQDKNDDDRRLFYVAITRAKKELSVSFPQTLVSDTKTTPVTPSVFVYELQSVLGEKDIQLLEKSEEETKELVSTLLTPHVPSHAIDRMHHFFEHTLSHFSLSVTALNNYLRDPEYFIFNDILRLPQAKAPYLAFGTAVHAALEKVYQRVIQGEADGLLELAEQTFEESLNKEVLNKLEHVRRLSHGKEVLKAYLEEFDVHQSNAWQTERKFGSGFARTALDDISLVGRIDRFDWVDKSANLVRVVDYKTGSPKSVNEIEGRTQSAELSAREQELPETIRGPYKRQLLFYKLLTELDKSFKPTVVSGVFEFVEPEKIRGTFVRREFELKDADVQDLKELIRIVMKEIRSLQFLEVLAAKK